VPALAAPGRGRSMMVRQEGGLEERADAWEAALQPGVLKVAVPGYLAAAGGIGAAATGVIAVAAWPFIAAAVSLHALATVVNGRAGTGVERFSSKAEPELAKSHQGLRAGFSELHSSAGLRALGKLTYEYNRLEPLLARRQPLDSFALRSLPAVALDVFRQGVAVLQSALDLMWVCGPEDYARLRAEEAELQRQIAGSSHSPDRALSEAIARERLATTRSLMEQTMRQRERVVLLLHEADKCSVSLHRLRMEMANLRAQDSDHVVAETVERLRSTVERARAVQDEMRRLVNGAGSAWESIPAIDLAGVEDGPSS
jgi:hypothetical protein